jgi:predicted secreted Zn-dependent protease
MWGTFMTRNQQFLLTISCLLFSVQLAVATPVINTQYDYYSVYVRSAPRLLSALNYASPIKENGRVFHGHTEANIGWKFRWKETYGKCQISSATTTLSVKMTLPKLAHDATDPNLKQLWSAWYPGLLKHEQGHADHAIEAANKIDKAIRNLPAETSCRSLERKAHAVGNDLVEKLMAQDREYDRVTDHGRKNSVSLSRL